MWRFVPAVLILSPGCLGSDGVPPPTVQPKVDDSPPPDHPPPLYHSPPAHQAHPPPSHPHPVHPHPVHHYGPGYAPPPSHYSPPHHTYGYSPAPPAYGLPQHGSYGYTPAPSYHPPASGYPAQHPPAKHSPIHHKPKYEGPPACSKNTTKAWCLEDSDYPAYEISHAIEYNYAGVATLYKDVLANTENSVDRLVELPQETYLCPSTTQYLMPLRAVNTDGKWRIIVNGVNAHYETLTQTARLEECSAPGEACPLVPECYQTKCVQKSVYHRFLVYDPYDHYFPFAMEAFKLPGSCSCFNAAYEDSH